MSYQTIGCSYCTKEFLRDKRHVNENIKLNQKTYCSLECLSRARIKQYELICENPKCKKLFKRQKGHISKHNFCSHSCAATITNWLRSGSKPPIKKLTEEERKKTYKGSSEKILE